MEKKCYACGSIAVSTDIKVNNRVVFSCSNRLCDIDYIVFKGEIILISKITMKMLENKLWDKLGV